MCYTCAQQTDTGGSCLHGASGLLGKGGHGYAVCQENGELGHHGAYMGGGGAPSSILKQEGNFLYTGPCMYQAPAMSPAWN